MDVIFAAITWPWVLLPIAVLLLATLQPWNENPSIDRGTGAAIAVMLFFASLWGSLMASNPLFGLTFPLIALAAIFASIGFSVLLNRMHSSRLRQSEEGATAPDKPSRIDRWLIVVLGPVFMLLPFCIDGLQSMSRFVALFVPVLFAALATALFAPKTPQQVKKGLAIAAFSGLIFLLSIAAPWGWRLSMADALVAVPLPADSEKVGPVVIEQESLIDCAYASGRWRVQASFNEVEGFIQGQLSEEGWEGQFLNATASGEGYFRRDEDPGYLKIELMDEAALGAGLDVLAAQGGVSQEAAVDDAIRTTEERFKPDEPSDIRIDVTIAPRPCENLGWPWDYEDN